MKFILNCLLLFIFLFPFAAQADSKEELWNQFKKTPTANEMLARLKMSCKSRAKQAKQGACDGQTYEGIFKKFVLTRIHEKDMAYIIKLYEGKTGKYLMKKNREMNRAYVETRKEIFQK